MKSIFQATLLLWFVIPAFSAVPVVDFDRGSDIGSVLRQVKLEKGDSPHPSQANACSVRFSGEKLVLKGAVNYARAEYLVGKDCSVALSKIIYSTAGVAMAHQEERRGTIKRSFEASKKLSEKHLGLGKWDTYGCTVNVWEEDVAGIQVINMQNHTTWDADSSGIISGRVIGNSAAYLDWWLVDGKPFVDIGNVTPSHIGGSVAISGFFCDGSLFCQTCSTLACYIRLSGNFQFTSSGDCIGWGEYDGEIIPAGRVTYEVIR